MKYLLLILIAVSTVVSARCIDSNHKGYEVVVLKYAPITPLPSPPFITLLPPVNGDIIHPTNPGIVAGEIFTAPQPKKAVAQELPSAEHLKLLAQADARAKEATRQWWIDFFNNNIGVTNEK